MIMASGKIQPLMKHRLLVFGRLITSITGLMVVFDTLGVSDLRRCHTAAESYRQSTAANPFVVLGGVVLSDHPKPVTNTVDTELKAIFS